jgi:hypothetical protein
MTDIVVEIRKGMVTGLYCDVEDVRFVVVDWDLVERSESRIGIEQEHSKLTSLPADTRMELHRATT